MSEVAYENKAIGRIEGYYMQQKRNAIYISLEEVEDTEWFWCPSEIKNFDRLWKEKKPVPEMAEELGRSEVAVLLLSLDRIFKGKIEPREWRIW